MSPTTIPKREARRLRRELININGAAYGQPLGDRIPVTPELQDALSEAAQTEGMPPVPPLRDGLLLTDHPEWFSATGAPVAYPVEDEPVVSWDDIDMGASAHQAAEIAADNDKAAAYQRAWSDARYDAIAGGETLVPLFPPADWAPGVPLFKSSETMATMDALAAALQETPPIREQILVEAGAAVMGDRDRSYGGPEDSFTRIADLWEAHFGYHFDSSMVAQALLLMKMARIAQNPSHRDSWRDAAGYAACGAEVSGAVA